MRYMYNQGFAVFATKKDERDALLARGNREMEMTTMGGGGAAPSSVTSL